MATSIGCGPIRRILVANRSEIAIRVFRAASELGIATVAVYAEQDKLSLHRFKADEAYQIGRGLGPIPAYLSIDEIIGVAVAARVDAIHPGYGFLSESPEFAEACAAAGILFIGPTPDTMRRLGDKVEARGVAISAGVPVMPASGALPYDDVEIHRAAEGIGYPLMLKAIWGGGGRGMRPIESEAALLGAVASARREAMAAFGKDEVYIEKLIRRARHVEVQLLGDQHGSLFHLFERDCSIQRRRQKVVERAPAPYLDSKMRSELCEAALRIGRAVGYVGAGTVEFLVDVDSGAFYFIEVNPRIQVEHTVTEAVTRLDIVKAQIRIAEGGRLGSVEETGIPPQDELRLEGHAIQCRITTEDPQNSFIPDYGRITAFRRALGFGIRVDGGTAYSGATVTPFYDSMLEKVVAWAATPHEAIARMDRALREYRVRGVATNLAFLETLLAHPSFGKADYTTNFVDETTELLTTSPPRDRATRLLTYLAEVTVNGHPEAIGRARPPAHARAPEPPVLSGPLIEGSRQRLLRLGAEGFSQWMLNEAGALVTDTTMRDGHQSLLATRMRTFDMGRIAPAYAGGLPQLLSIECWGGATFDVAMRYLGEDPWSRLAIVRDQAPNVLLQMLLRGANGVGYTNYPDNVVRNFIREAAAAGVDLFRIFDCFNWVENMRVAIDEVAECGKIAEGAICYTGDILDPSRSKYSLAYYVEVARSLERAGCHVLAIKDMAGLLKPAAARVLVAELKQAVGLPIHLHTHDTSGISGATVLAAVEAGVDAFDAAMDSMSGVTSQPPLGSIVEALKGTPRDTGLAPEAIRKVSLYWESVRTQYAAFESDLRSGASEVYLHEMPGGQFTNLKEQARSMGLDARWHDVAQAYRAASELFGDIIKVTPSSKVVGDMALAMVSQNLLPSDVTDPSREVVFPASVIEMMRGDLGQPPGGFPAGLQAKVLRGGAASTARPGALLKPLDLEEARRAVAERCGREVGEQELASASMYPEIFVQYCLSERKYGPVEALPTLTYFYGLAIGEEISVELERGKSILVRLEAIGEPDEFGEVQVFFELNGQRRVVRTRRRDAHSAVVGRKADPSDPCQVAAPMSGAVSALTVRSGQRVRAGEPMMTIEAMKMETQVCAPFDARVDDVVISAGASVEAKDLLLILTNEQDLSVAT